MVILCSASGVASFLLGRAILPHNLALATAIFPHALAAVSATIVSLRGARGQLPLRLRCI